VISEEPKAKFFEDMASRVGYRCKTKSVSADRLIDGGACSERGGAMCELENERNEVRKQVVGGGKAQQ